jgi:hypothetical protein
MDGKKPQQDERLWREAGPVLTTCDHAAHLEAINDRLSNILRQERQTNIVHLSSGPTHDIGDLAKPADQPRLSWRFWYGGIALAILLVIAAIWTALAAVPLLAGHARQLMRDSEAALARAIPFEPGPRRWRS